jgi:hypothetical protein
MLPHVGFFFGSWAEMRRNGVNSCGSEVPSRQSHLGFVQAGEGPRLDRIRIVEIQPEGREFGEVAMIVRSVWPSCDYRQKNWEATSMDCFWVEATHEEAIESVFPLLSRELELESEELAFECEDLAKTISQPPRSFCFLVARDLSSIDPFEVHYPFHQLWNAHSPFRSLADRTITSLHELAGISIEVNS